MVNVVAFALINGSIYSLFAVAVTLLYRGTRSLSFALGEVGTFGLITASVAVDHGAPWLVGAAVGIVVGVALALAFERIVVRGMGGARVNMAVASIGLLSFLIALELFAFGAAPRSLRAPLAGGAFSLGGVVISKTQVVSFVVLALVAAGVNLALRRTDFGLGVLAAATDPDAASLVGVELGGVARFVWGASATLAVVAALLVAPGIGAFAPGFATELFLKGLVSAVVGGLTNLNGAIAGGFTVGFLEAAGKRLFRTVNFPGLELVILLVLVLGTLIARPNGLYPQARVRGTA
jgi:branched-subunit amino acid ABC-type transport system permease component